MVKTRRHVRIALALGVASAASVALLYPYLLVLIPKLGKTAIPLWALVPIQAVQGGLQLFALGWVGLRVGAPLGLDAPLLRAWLDDPASRPASTRFGRVALLGLAVGALLVALDRWLFLPAQPEAIRALGAAIARWKGLLASFYGGIGEEVITRQFLMSLVAWVLVKLARRRAPAVYVAAAVIAALAFAAAHLPAAAQLAPLDRAVVARVIVLNGVAGIAFGLLFWRRGLEHAMVAHFCADLVLHVVAP